MLRNKIPMRTSEERSIPQSEHETLKAMAAEYVFQHASLVKQLANKIADSEAQHLFEEVRKTKVLLRKLGNRRHDHYDTLVSLDQVQSQRERLNNFIWLAALTYCIIVAMSYFHFLPITTSDIDAIIYPQESLLVPCILGGIVAFRFISYHFHRVRLEDLRDQLAWRVDDATSEVELINSRLPVSQGTLFVRYRDIWEYADLLYLQSSLGGGRPFVRGFIDTQARRTNLRSPFDVNHYGFYPEATFMSGSRIDPRMPTLDRLIECKLFIGLMMKYHFEAYRDVCEEWEAKGLKPLTDYLQDYGEFQEWYNAQPLRQQT